MQYILSQEEYQELLDRKEDFLDLKREKLQELCSLIADTMPVKWGWSDDEEAKPWGCFLTRKSEWYCDSCPVQDICPELDKSWSK